ncbi:hypothetical protein BT96DRAFT_1024263 [Gymnopus androsaceus JB14]|uniref:Uncharacterized protein n=1 Tax=Gymnopus androsaceus JB14 TaxID=1447944 RepID=A0A6A4H096_9AGAR|nr:hypothetical protein BT96DRAFT_1024263 [Gymnopus androsaceus JB14]
MQMFNRAHHFTINDGNFSNSNTQNNYYGASHDLSTRLNPVVNASFKSEHHSSCLDGTRTGILEMLMDWAKDPHSQPIFWLSGIAGTGKSTIAQSFCESLEKHNLLGGSFFCSRESEDRREVGRIIPTLANFLAQQFKPYFDELVAALEADATLASHGIKRQLESLVLHRVQKIDIGQEYWHFVLVIDALDECEDVDAIQTVLSILRAMVSQFYSHIHVFISCRPEYYIQQEFEKTLNKHLLKLHDVENEVVQKDIQLYLQRSLHDKSVSKTDVQYLSDQAGKFFIYAFTQVQYLTRAPGAIAFKSRLRDLLENKFIAKSIDGLYNLLLTKAIEGMEPNEKQDAKYLVNLIVSLSDPLSQQTLSELWKPCDVAPFTSVLNIPESQKAPIHIFHASFPDFILNQNRCHEEFYCNADEIHEIMSLGCIKCMNKNLKYNICNMQIDEDVSTFSVAQISSSLQYSCKHWIFHLTKCKVISTELMTELKKFAVHVFFFWMEALCILQSIENAIPGLKAVSTWLQGEARKEQCRLLHSITYEGQRFLQSIISLIRHYPLQLYYSGMVWLPKLSVLRRIQSTTHYFPKVLHGLEDTWDLCEVMIKYSKDILCIGISPDGKQVVSGSDDKTICIWKAATGQQIQKLEGHSGSVHSVAFSPDGKQVVSSSYDKKVCIWNVATGQQIQRLEGHFHRVYSASFSPDGKKVVSVSGDNTIRIWDAATGRQIQNLSCDWVKSVVFSPDGKQVAFGIDKGVFKWNIASGEKIKMVSNSTEGPVAFSRDGKQLVSGGHHDYHVHIWDLSTGQQNAQINIRHFGRVHSVAFSPDGKQVVSGSDDKTVCIWNATTGQQIQKFEGCYRSVNSVAFSPDGKQVVSGSNDGRIRIWRADYHSAEQIQKPGGHSEGVTSVAFSPDGTQVVSGSYDKTVRIWNVVTGQPIQKLAGRSSWVSSVVFSPDGKQVVSRSYDKRVCIWDVATGQMIPGTEATAAQILTPKNLVPKPDIAQGSFTEFTYNSALHFFEPSSNHSGSIKLWILPQYQDIAAVAQHKLTICFGCDSGAVIIIQMPVVDPAVALI